MVSAVLDRLLSKLSQCDMDDCAEHADNKKPHAEIMELLFVTVDHLRTSST